MPRVSVIVPTNRVGGLDLIFDSLEIQTYKDFELILSDNIFKYRKDLVAERSESYKFPIIHTEPFNNPFPLNSYCRSVNAALAYASGELVVMLSDYSWQESYWLQKHIEFHDQNQNMAVSSPHVYLDLFPVHSSVTDTYGPVAIMDTADAPFEQAEINGMDKYVQDLDDGVFDQVMWSLFEDGVNLSDTPLLSEANGPASPRDIKLGVDTGVIPPTHVFLKNDSFRLDQMMELNGIDEELDGAHGYQDYDISYRFVEKLGVQWYCDASNVVFIPNPRLVFRMRSRNRSNYDNRDIYEAKRAAGFPTPNTWSLKERNARIRSGNRG